MTYREAREGIDRGVQASNLKKQEGACGKNNGPCPQLPGTVLRIFIPAGAAINLLNLVELSSPGGICIVLRLPFLAGRKGGFGGDILGLFDSIRQCGGSVEVLDD